MLTNLNKGEMALVDENPKIAKMIEKAEKAGAKDVTTRVTDAFKDARETAKAFEDRDAKKNFTAGVKHVQDHFKGSAA